MMPNLMKYEDEFWYVSSMKLSRFFIVHFPSFLGSRVYKRLRGTSFMATSKLAEATFYGVSVSDGSSVSTLRFSYLFLQGCNFVAR